MHDTDIKSYAEQDLETIPKGAEYKDLPTIGDHHTRWLAREVLKLRADLAAVRGACALALRWLGDPDDPNGTFEDIGAWYQRETGRLRPGKSLPMEMAGDSQEEREKHFRAWADAKDREVRAALKSAGGASRTERGAHAKGFA